MSDQFVLPTALLSLPVALIRLGLRLRSIDLCINFDQYYALSELFARTTKFSIGFKHDERRCYTSVAVRYDEEKNEKLLFHSLAVAAAKSSGLKLGNISFSINEFLNGFSPSLQLQLWVGQAKALKKPTVILYPGSSPNAAFRRWGTDKYQALARRLTQNGYLVIIAGGPDEQGMVAEFHDIDRLCFNMIGQWSLRDWFWIFKTWPDLIFCGTDAGLYHLADLSGLLVIGLFGPNSQKKWGSLNPNSRDLDLTVPCSPCIHNGLGIVPQSCKVIHRECLTGISVSDVFERINSKPSYP